MQDVPVIAAIGFGDVAEGVPKVELAAVGAGVVARDAHRAGAELQHDAAARVLPVEVAARAEEAEVEFARAEGRSRADDGVIDRVRPIPDVVDVGQEAAGEVLTVEQRSVLAVVSVEPGEVAPGEGFGRGRRQTSASRPCAVGGGRRWGRRRTLPFRERGTGAEQYPDCAT